MYQNLRWIAETHEAMAYHERNLPVNPPGGHYTEGDVMLTEIGILNWLNDDGQFEFRPRLRDNVQEVERRFTAVADDEAPELDWDYGYDCD